MPVSVRFYDRHFDAVYPEGITEEAIYEMAAVMKSMAPDAFNGVWFVVKNAEHTVSVSYPDGMDADTAYAGYEDFKALAVAYLRSIGIEDPADAPVITTGSALMDNPYAFFSTEFARLGNAKDSISALRLNAAMPEERNLPKTAEASGNTYILFVPETGYKAEPIAEDTGRITVTGNAEIKITPDLASFTITAGFTEATTEEARVKTAAMTAEAVRILTEDFGISEDDITTSYISAFPEYGWVDGHQELRGQRAEESISVETGDLEAIGSIYEALMKLDGITLSDVTLDRKDKSEAMQEARIAAMMAAESKARTYAETAGMTLGKPVSISEGAGSYVPVYGIQPRLMNVSLEATADSAMAAPKTEYRAGDITVTASVSVVYGMR